jgi:hypothetical protein
VVVIKTLASVHHQSGCSISPVMKGSGANKNASRQARVQK